MAQPLVDTAVFQRVAAERRKAESDFRARLALQPSLLRETLDWAIYFAFPCCVFGAGVGYIHGYSPGAMIAGALLGCAGAVGFGALYAYGVRLE